MAILLPQQQKQEKEESDLDKIAKFVGLINQGTGIYSNIQKGMTDSDQRKLLVDQRAREAEKAQRDAQAADEKRRGIITKSDLYERQKDYDVVKEGTPGAIGYDVQEGEGINRIFMKAKAPVKDPFTSEMQMARYNEMQRKAQQDQQDRLNKGVSNLSDTYEKTGLGELVGQLDIINNTIPGGIDGEDDIPGYGATAWAPGFAISKEGQDARQAVAGLRNVILRARSGGAVTPQEANRLLEEIGTGVEKDDRQLRKGLQQVREKLFSKIQNVEAGADQSALAEFVKRPGTISSQSPIFSLLQKRAQTPPLERNEDVKVSNSNDGRVTIQVGNQTIQASQEDLRKEYERRQGLKASTSKSKKNGG